MQNFIFIALLMFGCGVEKEKPKPKPLPIPIPNPAPAPAPGGNNGWDRVAAILGKNCASCHNGIKQPLLVPASVFKASQSKAYLISNAMPPPPKKISEADKAVLLDYLNQ